MAIQLALLYKLINVKSFSGLDATKKVNMLHNICYKNFNAFLFKCFIYENCYYVVFKYTTILLAYIVKSLDYLTQS